MKIKTMDLICDLVKRYGVGLILFVFFLWQYIDLNKERRDIQEAFETLSKENIVVLIKVSDRLDKIENNNEKMVLELKEIRYEQCVNNNIMGKEPKRYITED